MQGWIKLHRQLLNWEWYSDINVTRLFTHCLLKANHKDGNWRGFEVKRGQFITSLDALSRETSLSKSKIRTAIKKLISTHEIAHDSGTQHTVITVLCYDSYQGDDTRNDKPVTHESHTNDTRIASNNNVKNENNDKNEIITTVKPSPKTKFSEDDLKFVTGMVKLLIRTNPNFKEPNKNTWAEGIRKMREIDGIDHKTMAEVFRWANADSFWSSNIQSPTKFRKQWNTLSSKALQTNKQQDMANSTLNTIDSLQGGF